jgi:hypothetical protein
MKEILEPMEVEVVVIRREGHREIYTAIDDGDGQIQMDGIVVRNGDTLVCSSPRIRLDHDPFNTDCPNAG